MVKVAAFKSEFEFFEAQPVHHVDHSWGSLGSAVCVASFLEDFVFDSIRARGYTWQFAAVFLVVVLQHRGGLGGAAHSPS